MFLDKLFVFYLGNKDKKTEPSSSTAAAVVTIAARPWAWKRTRKRFEPIGSSCP